MCVAPIVVVFLYAPLCLYAHLVLVLCLGLVYGLSSTAFFLHVLEVCVFFVAYTYTYLIECLRGPL